MNKTIALAFVTFLIVSPAYADGKGVIWDDPLADIISSGCIWADPDADIKFGKSVVLSE